MTESNKDSPQRKSHHLSMAEVAQTNVTEMVRYFDYEPLLSGFPKMAIDLPEIKIANKVVKAPLWISSMTGGTGEAGPINKNLAKVAGKYGLGMGLGSCRPLLDSDEYFSDFDLRGLIGEEGVLYANFGIAQLEEQWHKDRLERVLHILEKLKVDGLFLHINPLQEWYQPEGDRWQRSPLELIKNIQEVLPKNLTLGVKEVGQGMGPESLRALIDLKVPLVEFAAFGGTNFSVLEGKRPKELNDNKCLDKSQELCFVGHSASEMVTNVNKIIEDRGLVETTFIISGGIRSFLQGHYLRENLKAASLYGMAKPFLKAAAVSYEELDRYVQRELEGLTMATYFLKAKQLKQ